jgi:hypothetical protein
VVLLRSPDMYARYVNHLEYIMRQALSPAFMADVAQRQLADLFGLIDNTTAAGMLELVAERPENAIAANARSKIEDTMNFYTHWMEDRVRVPCRSPRTMPTY